MREIAEKINKLTDGLKGEGLDVLIIRDIFLNQEEFNNQKEFNIFCDNPSEIINQLSNINTHSQPATTKNKEHIKEIVQNAIELAKIQRTHESALTLKVLNKKIEILQNSIKVDSSGGTSLLLLIQTLVEVAATKVRTWEFLEELNKEINRKCESITKNNEDPLLAKKLSLLLELRILIICDSMHQSQKSLDDTIKNFRKQKSSFNGATTEKIFDTHRNNLSIFRSTRSMNLLDMGKQTNCSKNNMQRINGTQFCYAVL